MSTTAVVATPTLDEIVVELINIMKKHSQATEAKLECQTPLADAGVDSFDVVELIFQVEDKYGIAVDFNANTNLTPSSTIGDVARMIMTCIEKDCAAK